MKNIVPKLGSLIVLVQCSSIRTTSVSAGQMPECVHG